MGGDSEIDDRIEIGVVSRAHGIRGEVVVVPHDPNGESLHQATRAWVGGVEFEISGCRGANHGMLVKLVGVDDRNMAERLRGQPVVLPRADVATDGEIILDDLVGCDVRLVDGTSWGKVVAVEIGPQDRLVIRDDDVERLLPFVHELVTNIDLDAAVITIDPADDWPSEPLAQVGRVRARGVDRS